MVDQTRERDVIQAFVELSNDLVQSYDMVELLSRLTTSCAHLLDVASAGLLLSDSAGTLHLVAASSERTHHLEVFQLQRDEGPCLDCFRRGEAVIVPDLAGAARRWPQFAAEAAAAGFASVHALPMRLRDTVLGALGLFGEGVGRLDDDDVALAQALVHVASVAVVNEKAASDQMILTEQLQTALESRVVLEQAKGVVAHAGQVDMAVAFAALRGFARAEGRRLTDVSTDVVARRLGAEELLRHAGVAAPRPE